MASNAKKIGFAKAALNMKNKKNQQSLDVVDLKQVFSERGIELAK